MKNRKVGLSLLKNDILDVGLLDMVFLVNRLLRVNFVLPLAGFEGSGTLGLVASLIASPLDLMLMTARVITTGPEDRGSSLWLLVSESGRKHFNQGQFTS